MGIKTQKTKAYINKEFDCRACEHVGVCKYGQGADSAALYDCDAERIAEAFEDGWNDGILEINSSAEIKIKEADDYARKKMNEVADYVCDRYSETINELLSSR